MNVVFPNGEKTMVSNGGEVEIREFMLTQDWHLFYELSEFDQEWVIVVAGKVILHGPDLHELMKEYWALGYDRAPLAEFISSTEHL